MMRSWIAGCLLLAVSTFPAAGQVLPKAPAPSQKMLAINVGSEPSEVKFLVYVLQGLVNRTQPRLYVADNQPEGCGEKAAQPFTKDWAREALEKEGIEFRETTSVAELLQIFQGSFKGTLLYGKDCWSDPARAHVLNGIITECALEDLLPVTEDLNKQYKLTVMGSAEARWPQVGDFYYWAGSKNPLLENLNRRMMLYKHPWSFAGIDYAVANRLMTVWFDRATFDTERGRRRLIKVLEQTKPNTAVLAGCLSGQTTSSLEGVGEGELLRFLSAHGKFTVPVASPGNFSVHSGLKAGELKQKKIEFRALDRSKVYVTFLLSGRGSVPALNLVPPSVREQGERGTLPIGWTFNPLLLDLCPALLKQAYEAATPADYFVAEGAGFGVVGTDYGTSTTAGAGLLEEYLKMTGELMGRADTRELRGGAMDDKTVARYGESLPGLNGLFVESRDAVLDISSHAPPISKPVFANMAPGDTALRTDEDVTTLVELLKSSLGTEMRPRIVFVGFRDADVDPTRLAEFVQKLPPDCVVVRPDEFVHLCREMTGGSNRK